MRDITIRYVVFLQYVTQPIYALSKIVTTPYYKMGFWYTYNRYIYTIVSYRYQ